MKQNETKRMMGKKKAINIIRRLLRKIVLFIDQLTFKKVITGIITLIANTVLAFCLILLFFVSYDQTCDPNYIKDNIQYFTILVSLSINCCFILYFTTKE